MTITVELARRSPEGADATAVGVVAGALADAGIDEAYADARRFEAKVGQTLTVPTGDGGGLTVFVGLGDATGLDAARFRSAGAAVARATRRLGVVAATVPDASSGSAISRSVAVAAFVEGLQLGGYRFSAYKSKPDAVGPDRVVIVGGSGVKVSAAAEQAGRLADAVNLARDLVNEPGGELTPTVFAAAAEEVAEREGLDIHVMSPGEIADRGLGGLLGVNRGSSQEPRFVQLTYEPVRPRGTLALVGKGITFDSGGLSLKTSDGMMTMKDDMGGAAAVLGAMSVLGAVGVRARVRAYIPLTDNMTGGDATRPGDVLRIADGTTVEVLNTDAEGRLVLADALCLATEDAPDAIIDVATLTGAAEIALGKSYAGLMGNHDGWIEQVRAVADATGERVWPLPLPEIYRPRIDSDVADIKNHQAGRDGGALVAGLFLREFVGAGIPWAHLDIAGPAWAVADDHEITKGGTGFGVRLLVELARSFRRPA